MRAQIRSAADRFRKAATGPRSLAAADLVLSPAACYPVYPLVASRGALPAGGLIFDVSADCFRREPSARSTGCNRSACASTCASAAASRSGFSRGLDEPRHGLADELALPYTLDVASDPFFGRVGQMMAVSQVQNSLKFELLIPFYPGAKPTACMSFNYHQEHFGEVWGLNDDRHELAHTGCVAFGMDRLAVALFANHGIDLARWPASARRALAL